MNKKIILSSCGLILMLSGCELNLKKNIDEEPVKKEESFELEVEKEKKEQKAEDVKGEITLVREVGDVAIYKNDREEFYVVEGEHYIKKEEANPVIFNKGYLDFKKAINIQENLEKKTVGDFDFKVVVDDEEIENFQVREGNEQITMKDLKNDIKITIESQEEQVQEETKKEMNTILKEVQKNLYKQINWLEQIQGIWNYGDERWRITEQGQELTMQITGQEYVEINQELGLYANESQYKKETRKYKNQLLRMTQYNSENEYVIDVEIKQENGKNSENKKIIIEKINKEQKEKEMIKESEETGAEEEIEKEE